jgi:hypothetical protein
MRISRTVLGYEPTGPVRDAPVIDAGHRPAKVAREIQSVP